jgi:hypothetical protein
VRLWKRANEKYGEKSLINSKLCPENPTEDRRKHTLYTQKLLS